MQNVVRTVLACLIVSLGHVASSAFAEPEPDCVSTDGCVATAEAAIVIAERVLNDTYGVAQIEKQKTLVAQSVGEVWVVRETLGRGKVGGVAEIWISKRNGDIIKVTHGE